MMDTLPKKPIGPGQIVAQAYGADADVAVGAEGVHQAYDTHRRWVEAIYAEEEDSEIAVRSGYPR